METIFVLTLVACLVMLTSCESDSNNMYPKYKFQFKTGDDGDHTRAEESDTTGRVTGMYSYLDPNGILRTIRYNAAPGTGYQAYGDGILQIGSDITNSVDSNSIFSRNNETKAVDDLKSSNDIVQQDIESQTSESVATESPAAEVSSEALNDSENESKSAPGNSSDDSSTSFNINRNRIVPLIFPYGPYHPILIRSGSVLHAIPHAFTYNLVAPRYQFIL